MFVRFIVLSLMVLQDLSYIFINDKVLDQQ